MYVQVLCKKDVLYSSMWENGERVYVCEVMVVAVRAWFKVGQEMPAQMED